MKLMTVTLGLRWAGLVPNKQPQQLSVHINSEFTPDEVFQACNRINDLADDIDQMPHRWQHELRTELEFSSFPSMSIGDRIHVAGIGVWICKNIGWDFESTWPVSA